MYAMLPPECQEECRGDVEAAERKLLEIQTSEGVCYSATVAKRFLGTRNFWNVANLALFNKFKNSLFAKGYLENAPTKPKNLQPTTLGKQT